MRYSKTLAKFCNEDKRMETGSYFFDSDGHWALIEGENYSMDDGHRGIVHGETVQEFMDVVRIEVVNIPHENYERKETI
jgi:hypothetical protein